MLAIFGFFIVILNSLYSNVFLNIFTDLSYLQYIASKLGLLQCGTFRTKLLKILTIGICFFILILNIFQCIIEYFYRSLLLLSHWKAGRWLYGNVDSWKIFILFVCILLYQLLHELLIIEYIYRFFLLSILSKTSFTNVWDFPSQLFESVNNLILCFYYNMEHILMYYWIYLQICPPSLLSKAWTTTVWDFPTQVSENVGHTDLHTKNDLYRRQGRGSYWPQLSQEIPYPDIQKRQTDQQCVDNQAASSRARGEGSSHGLLKSVSEIRILFH